MVGFPSGPITGVNPPRYITGHTYLPYGFQPGGATAATAVNDLYYYPFFVWKTQAFAGAKTFNAGAGDNGETLRLGVYADDGAIGGPGTLLKDFGEVTLTGAAALRTLANAVTLPGPAWYWMAYAANTAATIAAMAPITAATAVGYVSNPMTSMLSGFKLSTQPNATTVANMSHGLFVNTAYGAFAATAVAPTSELSGLYATAGLPYPLMGIYV